MSDKIPNFLQRLSTDEYSPAPLTPEDRRVIAHTSELSDRMASSYRLRPELLPHSAATASGLIALNHEYGGQFYDVSKDAIIDDASAAAAFSGDGLVIDVQTHFMAPHGSRAVPREGLLDMYRAVMPGWWSEMGDIVKWDIAEYINNVFMETEIGVAVLTSGPGLDDSRNLFNDELAATRTLVDRFAGSGRLIQHSVVHADEPAEMAAMPEWAELYKPAAWKVYTPGKIGPNGWSAGWMLDDETYGYPFLEMARKCDIRRVCAHKGISLLVDNGSPRDIGPAAKAFPDIEFLVYHSGYEFPHHGAPPEGPYTEETAGYGINRLIHACLQAGIPRGGNVYPELGSTWFSIVRRPIEAAHVIGKLVAHFGENNVLWGSDSIWYGSSQPLIDAFRSFQIPDWMCERYGYQPLTKAIKNKILGGNAAKVYGIDLQSARARLASDDLQWAKLLIADYKKNGFSALR